MVSKTSSAVIINDHVLVSDMLCVVLKDLRIEVIASYTSAEAGVNFVIANNPALLILEMMLPTLRTFDGVAVDFTHPHVLQDCKRSFQAVSELIETFDKKRR